MKRNPSGILANGFVDQQDIIAEVEAAGFLTEESMMDTEPAQLAMSSVQPSDLAAVAYSGQWADVQAKPSLSAVALTGAYSDITGKPTLSVVATSGNYNDLTGKPSIPSAYSVGAPNSRTLSLATAYQATDNTKSAVLTITLQAQSSVSLSGASNNEGVIVIGSTSAVASGTGTSINNYKNNLGGTLVVGLNLNSQQANTYTIHIPAGYYFAVRQTSGTGLQIVSAFDQACG